MSKWFFILGGLLIVQLVVAVALNLGEEDYGAFEPEEKLLAIGNVAVDGLRIADGEESVVLASRDGRWLLPALGDFPADQDAVERLLDRLGLLEKGWPVATTASASRRFKVDDEAFERRLTLLSAGKTVAELFVGTSPGFRKVHARPAGEEAVFAVAFNTWEAGATADDWIDMDHLAVDESKVTRVEMPGVALQHDGDELKVADLDAGEQTDADEARALLDRLAGLRIESVLGTEAKPEYRQDEPALELSVTLEEGDELVYRFSKPEEGAYYVLKRSDSDHYFKVAEFAVDPVKGTDRETLVRAKTGKQTDDDPAKGGGAGTASTGDEKSGS